MKSLLLAGICIYLIADGIGSIYFSERKKQLNSPTAQFVRGARATIGTVLLLDGISR